MDVDDLDWIAAISVLGDIGDKAPFAVLAPAKKRYGAGVLRDATTLLNAPRRSASGDASGALALLMSVGAPARDLLRRPPEAAVLRRDKEEVNAAYAEAKKAAPKFAGPAAAIRIHTPCQVHPLVAQIWRTRLPKIIVMGVNTGYRPGWVHFSARCGKDTNLLDFFRAHRPDGADSRSYGQGHDQAGGGALPVPVWNDVRARTRLRPGHAGDEHAAPPRRNRPPVPSNPTFMTDAAPFPSAFPAWVSPCSCSVSRASKAATPAAGRKTRTCSRSIEYLHGVFDYLQKQKITMYRMSSDIAPYATHPDMPQFHGQVTEAAAELRALGQRARDMGLRLSFHPSQYTILNSPDPELNRKSVWDIESQATILDRWTPGRRASSSSTSAGCTAKSRPRWTAGWRATRRCPRRPSGGWCWKTTTSPTAPPRCWNSTRAPACRACSIRTTFAATTRRAWTSAKRREIPGDVADGRAAEDSRHFAAHADARTQTPQPQNQEARNRRAAAALDRALGLRRPVRVHRPDEEISRPGRSSTSCWSRRVKDLALRRLRNDVVRYAPDLAGRFGLSADEPAPRKKKSS